jgi:hypothetical protein
MAATGSCCACTATTMNISGNWRPLARLVTAQAPVPCPLMRRLQFSRICWERSRQQSDRTESGLVRAPPFRSASRMAAEYAALECSELHPSQAEKENASQSGTTSVHGRLSAQARTIASRIAASRIIITGRVKSCSRRAFNNHCRCLLHANRKARIRLQVDSAVCACVEKRTLLSPGMNEVALDAMRG